jgi:hypothetical protein
MLTFCHDGQSSPPLSRFCSRTLVCWLVSYGRYPRGRATPPSGEDRNEMLKRPVLVLVGVHHLCRHNRGRCLVSRVTIMILESMVNRPGSGSHRKPGDFNRAPGHKQTLPFLCILANLLVLILFVSFSEIGVPSQRATSVLTPGAVDYRARLQTATSVSSLTYKVSSRSIASTWRIPC